MKLSSEYPAGMRVSASVAMALVEAERYGEAANVVVILLDPLGPDGSVPLNQKGQPETSVFNGMRVAEKLRRGFRDPDDVPVAAPEPLSIPSISTKRVRRV